jgi:hypothetical protein
MVSFDEYGEVLLDSLPKAKWEAVADARRSLARINAMTADRSAPDPERLRQAASSAQVSTEKAIHALAAAAE